MSPQNIETLTYAGNASPTTSGFARPFSIERLCTAFGENVGGNRPAPSWFEGHDVLAALRHGTRGTPHMATAALLRRRQDGALRLVASDHLRFRNEFGADFMLARRHVDLAMETLQSAVDPEADADIGPVASILAQATSAYGTGPVDLLAERRMRDDLADARAARAIDPVLRRLDALVRGLSSAERRARALDLMASLCAEIGVDTSEPAPVQMVPFDADDPIQVSEALSTHLDQIRSRCPNATRTIEIASEMLLRGAG